MLSQVSSLVANIEHAESPGNKTKELYPPPLPGGGGGGKRFTATSGGTKGGGAGGGGGEERPKKASEERDCSNPLTSIIAPFTSMLG